MTSFKNSLTRLSKLKKHISLIDSLHYNDKLEKQTAKKLVKLGQITPPKLTQKPLDYNFKSREFQNFVTPVIKKYIGCEKFVPLGTMRSFCLK